MERVYSVTLVRPSSGLPSIEVGAYAYAGDGLPWVGDTIEIRRVDGQASDVVRGYVTRVDPTAENPISVTALQEPERDDVLARPESGDLTPLEA